MRQTEIHGSSEDRGVVDGLRTKGLHQAREVNPTPALANLDPGIQIMAVFEIARTAVWRDRIGHPNKTAVPKHG
jgi:hypothetical protein